MERVGQFLQEVDDAQAHTLIGRAQANFSQNGVDPEAVRETYSSLRILQVPPEDAAALTVSLYTGEMGPKDPDEIGALD